MYNHDHHNFNHFGNHIGPGAHREYDDFGHWASGANSNGPWGHWSYHSNFHGTSRNTIKFFIKIFIVLFAILLVVSALMGILIALYVISGFVLA